jgi:hypothetical protein
MWPVWKFLVALWLASSRYSWRRLPVAHDSPHVHAPGTNPDRILIAGDGASAGVGVMTHDLGLPGYLARNLSIITKRATDVDIAVRTDMSVAGCLEEIAEVELSRYDLIILSLGMDESLGFKSPRAWGADLTQLLDHIQEHSPATTETIVLSIPYFGSRSLCPRILQVPVDRHAGRLNASTQQVIDGRPNVSFLIFSTSDELESDGAHTYQKWAASIAPRVSEKLQPNWGVGDRSEAVSESSRQRALDALGLAALQPDAELDQIAATAKDVFGTSLAAITLIDNERQLMASAAGTDAFEVLRDDAFCNITIRRAEHFVIEDTSLDPRYSENPAVVQNPYIRFYAGYPVESPDGHRIGALCVMDTKPRSFTKQDAVLLRELAHRAQQRLWTLGGGDATSA